MQPQQIKTTQTKTTSSLKIQFLTQQSHKDKNNHEPRKKLTKQ